MKIIIYFIIFISGFGLGIIFSNSEFIKKDNCLDGGGSWNEEQKYCEYRKEK
jgi:hypothetical protein